MSDFYVSLPSHSNKSEFLENTANHFKIRLPNPICLEGQGWRVEMSSISLPDAQVSIPSFTNEKTDKKVILAYYAWRRIEHQTSDGYTFGEAYFDTDDLKDVFHKVTGVGFMKSMIAYFERQRMYKNSGPKFGAEYVTGGKRTYVKLKWEGEELVTDKKDI